MFEEQRQSSKLLKLRSFDVCKNAAALMIAMLGHLEIDIEVSDTDIKTTESNNCREVSEDDGDANNILATM